MMPSTLPPTFRLSGPNIFRCCPRYWCQTEEKEEQQQLAKAVNSDVGRSRAAASKMYCMHDSICPSLHEQSRLKKHESGDTAAESKGSVGSLLSPTKPFFSSEGFFFGSGALDPVCFTCGDRAIHVLGPIRLYLYCVQQSKGIPKRFSFWESSEVRFAGKRKDP